MGDSDDGRPSLEWTGASPLGDPADHGIEVWRVIARVLASPDEVFATVAHLANEIGTPYCLDERSVTLVSSWDGSSVEVRRDDTSGELLERIVGNRPFQGVITGSTMEITVSSELIDGDHLVEARYNTLAGDSRHVDALDAMIIDTARRITAGHRVVFVGAESVGQSDRREGQIAPRPGARSGSMWRDKASFAPCYYWLTAVGSRLSSSLGPVPVELVASHEKIRDRDGHEVNWFRLAEYSTDEVTIRSKLPALRGWLRPVLQGWIVSRGIQQPQRLLEGPPVAQVTAGHLNAWVRGLSWSDFLDTLSPELRSRLKQAPLDTAHRLRWSIEANPQDAPHVDAALRGAAAAVARTLREDWLGPIGRVDWDCRTTEPGRFEINTDAQGDIATVNRLLCVALACLPDQFLVFSRNAAPRTPVRALEIAAH